jgi:hypothetical protein
MDTEEDRVKDRILDEVGRPAPLFLERYDSKRVRGWGSANDMI